MGAVVAMQGWLTKQVGPDRGWKGTTWSLELLPTHPSRACPGRKASPPASYPAWKKLKDSYILPAGSDPPLLLL